MFPTSRAQLFTSDVAKIPPSLCRPASTFKNQKVCVFRFVESTPTSTLPNLYSKMQCSPYRYKLQHSISDYVKIYTSKAEVVPCSAMCCLPACQSSLGFFLLLLDLVGAWHLLTRALRDYVGLD